jgi:hypothetical protein
MAPDGLTSTMWAPAPQLRRGALWTGNLRTPSEESRVVTNGHEYDERAVYQIRIEGNLDRRWSDWFGGLTIEPQAGGETLLTGTVIDQAALHGLLAKIADLGLPLLSVKRVAVGSDSTSSRRKARG